MNYQIFQWTFFMFNNEILNILDLFSKFFNGIKLHFARFLAFFAGVRLPDLDQIFQCNFQIFQWDQTWKGHCRGTFYMTPSKFWKKGARKPRKGYCRCIFYTTPSKFRKKGARKPRKGHCRGPFYTTPSKFWKKEPESPNSRDIWTHFFYFPSILGQKHPFQKVKYSIGGLQ